MKQGGSDLDHRPIAYSGSRTPGVSNPGFERIGPNLWLGMFATMM